MERSNIDDFYELNNPSLYKKFPKYGCVVILLRIEFNDTEANTIVYNIHFTTNLFLSCLFGRW